MNKLANIVLTAHVNARRTGGKVKVVTDVTIRLDGKAALAFHTLGGKYTAEQALKEFKRDPSRFETQPGFDAAMVKLLAAA